MIHGQQSREHDDLSMGDKSPKNIRKQVEKKHEKVVEKVQRKHENAEHQHHPVSGHPVTPEEAEEAKAVDAKEQAEKAAS
jgi:hypothetical protein